MFGQETTPYKSLKEMLVSSSKVCRKREERSRYAARHDDVFSSKKKVCGNSCLAFHDSRDIGFDNPLANIEDRIG